MFLLTKTFMWYVFLSFCKHYHLVCGLLLFFNTLTKDIFPDCLKRSCDTWTDAQKKANS